MKARALRELVFIQWRIESAVSAVNFGSLALGFAFPWGNREYNFPAVQAA
jgi:hypothetical protein